MVKEPTVISTFAGCGGSSLGYKWAGFRELLAIDFDDNAVETFKLNFPDVLCWKRDIREVTGAEIMAACHIKPGELDVLDGSPPCQGFSTAGKRQVLDPRNDLFREYVRLIKELQPKVFVMENVSGMVKGTMRGRFIEIMKELKSTGYNVRAKLMNAKWYEVPQSRERIIFIGVKDGEPSFPKPTGRPITFRMATDGLSDVCDRPLPAALLNYAPHQPNSWNTDRGIYGRYVPSCRSHFSLKWAQWNGVLGTIPKSEIAYSGIVHPSRLRYLNLSELKRCATFPDDFVFTDRDNGMKRIGNAVMPRFMYHIAKNIKENILHAEILRRHHQALFQIHRDLGA